MMTSTTACARNSRGTWPEATVAATALRFLEKSLGSVVHQVLQYGFQRYLSLDGSGIAIFKSDPSFIKTIQHADARHRVFHALPLEQGFPAGARHDLHLYRAPQDAGKSGGDVV